MPAAGEAAHQPARRGQFHPDFSPRDPRPPLQEGRVAQPSDPERRHATRARGLNAGNGVLSHETPFGRHSQFSSGQLEDLRIWLTLAQVAATDIDAEGVDQTFVPPANRIDRSMPFAFFEEDAAAIGQPSSMIAWTKRSALGNAVTAPA